ncbi:succinyl-diaminopimelate desuccinylase [Buchnera aphidicola (Nipponaphis monzeni)]|uniref:Succinyl-diaminopimelate desuccinylase n=1 Tax=Buchnera aphidicola (Nipponaphis monzeni) TaxID=2495405 RepID=A0A455T9V1_9GAMM|nr:succinyl-diaminopimelate desuccinylase [Buchnera aphidicola]BBI01093.1 succinyl-diaminopimelate desuccinylase [Buchnera aphidicola (Nipponaphis monzeni)]
MLQSVVNLTKELISIPSISPLDLGCQDIIIKRLTAIGFLVEKMNFKNTKNVWAIHKGTSNEKTITFLGHTDIVPAGTINNWKFPPFNPTISKGKLFGRGAVDMKGALAAMIVAIEHFISSNPIHNQRLSVIITSDEESKATNGTVKVVNTLKSRNEVIDYCIIGEPTSINIVGDTIKNGRRGSLTANLTIYGKQGHIAYPKLSINPIHNIIPFLNALIKKKWDVSNTFFSKTTMQISQIHSGLNCSNITPGNLFVQFNFRFGSQITIEQLQFEVNQLLNFFHLKYSIKWVISGKPFITYKGNLLDTVQHVIKNFHGFLPKTSTSGGTSDGRFITTMGSEIVELGLINRNIHQVNEYVKISDLKLLTLIYLQIIKQLI